MDGLPREYEEHLVTRGFRPVRRIGSGLSGTVIEATQINLGRSVAVKFCDGMAPLKNAQLRKRFIREAQLLARIQHQAIPYILTSGTVPIIDISYTVLQFISGRRLRDELLPRKALDHDFAIRLMMELLDALGAAHKERIIHRDVSPENIMVSAGRCILIDFSIGMSLNDEPGLTRATSTGEHLGRAEYMAPEQKVDMANVDERCDLYAAAVVFLEMLTGSPRFAYESFDAQIGHLNPGIRKLLKNALAENRDNRFSTTREFSDALMPFSAAKATLLNCAVSAVCVNGRCDAAKWTPNGYYEGPKIYESTTDMFCESCGSALRRACPGCDSSFRGSPHCGSCGAQWYDVPVCETCGSWLKQQDMGTDTNANCCTKGRIKNKRNRVSSAEPVIADDDIPF